MPSGSFHKQLSSTATVGKRMGSSDNKMPTGKEHLRLQPLDHSDFATLEKGHRVCRLVVQKKFDIVYRRIWLNSQTHQIALTKCTGSQTDFGDVAGTSSNFPSSSSSKTHTLDLRLVKDAQILEQVENTMQIMEKWRRDSALLRFDQAMVLCIGWGAAFNLNNWLILFESKEACNLWCQGLRQLCAEQQNASHALVVERWLRKQFYALLPHPTDTACITIKHMKPFVQQRLQCKVSSKQLQEITEGDMGFEGFVLAHNRLLDFHSLFTSMFAEYASHELPLQVPFKRFVDFLRDVQHDKLGQSRAFASDFLRRYLRDVDSDRDMTEPWLSTEEFMDYLYSPENSLFDPINKEVVHDMSKPLTHYWISSSHNTYLTGDQLKSESSLDAYSRALLLGCRCIELDCWDGCQRKGANGGELIIDIVIYHGYTMTSKLALRDVLQTIKRYAFQTSEFPVILSIEDNCSVPAQRQMAVDIQEVLGDMLLTAPVSRDEWQLPSPAALRQKIILKHKKLCRQHQKRQQLDGSDSVSLLEDELDQQDILSRRCIKKGVLWLRASGGTGQKAIWAKHIFVLFADRLCYLVQPVDDKNDGTAVADGVGKTAAARENSLGSQGDENLADDSSSVGGGNNIDACVDAHLTEEWFHGKIDRDTAKSRLLENAKELFTSAEVGGGGLFLIRESSTFIGDFTLSFVHAGQVHHCRIKATLTAGGERKYHLLDTVRRDTLYELISYYTRHSLDTPNFKTFLQTPCPQPQPHLVQPWFSGQADTQRAEELLAAVAEDGAFLIRHSTQDRNVFVLSLRVDAKVWHYRLKRDGRLFVVNQQMFENLCQLVDYYGQQQFVRGVCLKYPVNEKTVDQYANKNPARLNGSDLSTLDSSFGGYYMELRDLEKEVQAEAVEPFEASAEFETKHLPSLLAPQKFLRFPIGAHITILHKTTGKEEQQNIIESRMDEKAEKEQQQQQPVSLWLGRYNNEIGWFPASCVQGFSPSTEQMDEASPAELNFGTIELVGTTFEESDSTDRAHSFQISLDQSHWNVQQYLVAAECQEELDDWLDACRKQVRLANDKIHQLRTKEKQLRIASELSSLVVYCQAVPFDPDFELQDPRLTFYEMCSFSEYKHEKLIERGLPLFNQRQLSRVYPQASRLTSTNFNPIPMWNSGCHMVALNFQTGDKPMQLNAGRFAANGRCGYVLKPQYLMDEMFRQQQPRASSANDIGRATQKCPKCVFSRRSTGNLPSLNSLSATLPGNKNRQPTNSKNAGTKSNHPPKLSLTISNSIEEELTIDDNCWTAEKVNEEMDGNCTCQCLTSEGNKTTEEEEAIDNDETATNMQAKGINTSLSHLNCPIAVDILLIAGRHLSRKGGQENKRGGICSPCVEIELLGFSHDSQIQKSGTITTNGLNPVWQERFHFWVQHPEMCLLRFHVEDGDFVGPKTDPFIGQSTLPLDCIRPGFRSVPLFNQFSEPLELSALLLYVNICHWNPNSTVEVGPTPSLPHRPSNSFLGSGSAVSAWLFDSTTAFGVIPASTAKADGCDGCTADNVRSESSQSEGIGGSPIWDVHQMLQAGRSTASHPSEEEENSLAGQMGKIRRENSSLESTGRIHHLNSTSNFGRGNSRTSRSTSMESSETTTTSSSAFMLPPAKRTMGTNTLRRIFFRMGRNGGNITKK